MIKNLEQFSGFLKEIIAMMLQINKAKKILGLERCKTILTTVMFIFLMTSNLSLAGNMNQQTFASPDEAVKTLIKALNVNDLNALEMVLGPDSQDLIISGDPVADQSDHAKFLKWYNEKNRLEQTNDEMVLVIGNHDWPFPIPIVKKSSLWFFDTEEGRAEILARRIGQNELDAIQVCMAYVDAQREYVLKDQDTDGLLQYAQKFKSDKGMKNGLYWDMKEGEQLSPMGPLIALAREEGYNGKATDDKPVPYHGYYYKILKAQGENAPGGAYDYVVRGQMIGGFALLACPAKYSASGIMTFIVNHVGVVYEKDLGPDTIKKARLMKKFDPDNTWEKMED
jgi:hypothetical protein